MALGVKRGAAGSSSSFMTSHWIFGLPATPEACTLVCPHTATLSCPRRQSAVLGGPLLAGPLVASDEAAGSLAAMDQVRLHSCSESSSVGGSRTLESRIAPHLQLRGRRHKGYVGALPLRKEWLVVHVDVRPRARLLLWIISDTWLLCVVELLVWFIFGPRFLGCGLVVGACLGWLGELHR